MSANLVSVSAAPETAVSAKPKAVPPAGRWAIPVAEFCERVGISRTLTYRLAARGELRLVKLGSRTIVPMDEVDRLLGVGQPKAA